VEFFRLVRARMTDGGMLIVNVYDASEKQELLGAMGATLKLVFPSVEKLSTEGGNHILFAFAEKRELAQTVARLTAGGAPYGSVPAWVRDLALKAAGEIVEFEPRAGAVVFTDDRTPIEEMTRKMLVEKRNKGAMK